LVILDVSSAVSVKREFKVLRRPISVAILDDASILAVLSTDLQVNLYNLTGSRVKHVRSISLDDAPRTIALSPAASVLAVAYDGGIEVYSLAPYALSTDRRAVKCDAVDSLSFSPDGTLLLGTTLHTPNPNTVILSAPLYNEIGHDVPVSELLSQMWTTQILFPNSSRDCSHATFLPCAADGEAGWTFTHDRVFETFRAVRVDDLRKGTTYFTGPNAERMPRRTLPSTLPAANDRGELVAAGFAGEIWLYGVPADLDFVSVSQLNTDLAGGSGVKTPSPGVGGTNSIPASATLFPPPPQPTTIEIEQESDGPPQWQVLCDKFRNLLVKGRQVAAVDGLSAVRWVSRASDHKNYQSWTGERLVAVAPGGVDERLDNRQEGALPVDGGRIVIFDFGRGLRNGTKHNVTIEVGEGDAELLHEEMRDLEAEVAIFRRRTVAKRRGGLGSRSDFEVPTATATSSSSRRTPASRPGSIYTSRVPSLLVPPTDGPPDGAPGVRAGSVGDDSLAPFEEVHEALDLPYSHTDPRSRTTLQQAATAVAANRIHNPPRIAQPGQVAYLRANGRRDPPHESDADNWVPPPPPYTPNPETPLPEHLLLTLLPRRTEPLQRVTEPPPTPARAQTTLEGVTRDALQRTRSTLERATLRARRISVGRYPNDAASAVAEGQLHVNQTESRPLTSSAALPSGVNPTGNVIPRRPVGASPGVRSFIEPSGTLAPDPSSLQSIRRSSYEQTFRPMQAPLLAITRPNHPQISLSQSSTSSSPTSTDPSPTHRPSNLLFPTQLSTGPRPGTRSVPDLRQSTSGTPLHSHTYDQNITPIFPNAEQRTVPQSRHSSSSARNSYSTNSRNYILNDLFGYPPRLPLATTTHSHPSRSSSARRLPRAPSLPDSSNASSSSSTEPQQRETFTRLDSIHSVPSRNTSSRSRNREPGAMPRRQTSRAGRSAAINIKDAKKRGWVKKTRVSRGDSEWGDSSAGWTDDTNESTMGTEGRGEEAGGRCIIM
jgi:hypothetical protein